MSTYLLFAGAALLLLSVLTSRVASRVGVPALLIFLTIGMLAGSEGVVGIEFDDPHVALIIGSVALALILFDGGLRTDLTQLDAPFVRAGMLLSSVGVAVTALVVGVFSTLLLGLSPLEGLLLGAVVSSTDAAAVFSVLGARGIGLPRRLRYLIEFESGSNDPTAVFLTVSLITMITSSAPAATWQIPLSFAYVMAGGILIGWLGGRAGVTLLNRVDLEHDGLYPVLTVAMAGCIFALSQLLQTSGFMAVYVAGLTMSGHVFVHKNSLIRFHEGLAWLMQVVMFLMLGLLVFPSELAPQLLPAVGVSAVLILVARPAATFIALMGSGLGLKEKAMVSWVGLRGAAPIILATFPMVAGLEVSHLVFNTVFVVVIMSVLVQGPTVGVVARRLGVAEPLSDALPDPIHLDAPVDTEMSLQRLRVSRSSSADGQKLLTIGGPSRPLVVLVRREGWLFIPTGGTRLLADDELFVLGSPAAVAELRELVERGDGGSGSRADGAAGSGDAGRA